MKMMTSGTRSQVNNKMTKSESKKRYRWLMKRKKEAKRNTVKSKYGNKLEEKKRSYS